METRFRLLKKITPILLAFTVVFYFQPVEAQLLEKLKERAKEKGLETREVSYDSSANEANRNSSSEVEELVLNTAHDFFNKDVILKMIDENGTLVQTLLFDKEVIAMRVEQGNEPNPMFMDLKGYMYAFNVSEGYYEKASILPPSLMGFMMAGMIPQFCNLPPEPYLEAFRALTDIDSGLNFMMLELAFIYKPIHFTDNENYTPENVKCNGASDCIRFNYNDPEYKESFIQFDNQERLSILNIKTTKTFGNGQKDSNASKTQEPSSGQYVFTYQDCSVKLPEAVELSMIPGPLGKLIPLEKGLEPWKHNKKDKQKEKQKNN